MMRLRALTSSYPKPSRAMRAGGEVLDQDVGCFDQAPERLLGGGVFQVERDRTLVAVYGEVVNRFGLDEGRSPVAGIVASPGDLDLDDVGSQVAQHHRAIGPHHDPGQVDDLHPGQRQAGCLPAAASRFAVAVSPVMTRILLFERADSLLPQSTPTRILTVIRYTVIILFGVYGVYVAGRAAMSSTGEYSIGFEQHDEQEEMTLSELVEGAGVSVRTVRYYIAEGLLPPPNLDRPWQLLWSRPFAAAPPDSAPEGRLSPAQGDQAPARWPGR